MKPLLLVTTFYPKPGRFDEFVAVQVEGLGRMLKNGAPGWKGNRLLTSVNGQAVVMVSHFESAEAQEEFTRRADFAEHRARISPLLERVESGQCELAFEAGSF